MNSLTVVYRKGSRCLPAVCTLWVPTLRLACMLFCQLSAIRSLVTTVLCSVVLPRCCKAPVVIVRRLTRCCYSRPGTDMAVEIELGKLALTDLDGSWDPV